MFCAKSSQRNGETYSAGATVGIHYDVNILGPQPIPLMHPQVMEKGFIRIWLGFKCRSYL